MSDIPDGSSRIKITCDGVSPRRSKFTIGDNDIRVTEVDISMRPDSLVECNLKVNPSFVDLTAELKTLTLFNPYTGIEMEIRRTEYVNGDVWEKRQ